MCRNVLPELRITRLGKKGYLADLALQVHPLTQRLFDIKILHEAQVGYVFSQQTYLGYTKHAKRLVAMYRQLLMLKSKRRFQNWIG